MHVLGQAPDFPPDRPHVVGQDYGLEFTMNSQHPRLSQNLSIEPKRGIRGSDFGSFRDGTPNPAYVVEWVSAFQVDLMSGGILSVIKEDFKKVHSLKNPTSRFNAQSLCKSTC